jgi:hypothetical protein
LSFAFCRWAARLITQYQQVYGLTTVKRWADNEAADDWKEKARPPHCVCACPVLVAS